ncbi:NUDIX domain-containing protein [Niabella sp. CC-SYL272]|uniref:NUDIX hydrolase n=1 Tax=Niabella agricola TaxID=2891571 RepID=UPI001F352C26|nr:NUDIX domain-containing protein [Niabella agricola]MCF3107929.1 NUDIX domain-containing protein [Niabella agricola]
MQIKIHTHNKILYLCDQPDSHLQELLHHPETVLIDELDTHSVKAMLRELTLPEIKTGIFVHPDFDQLKNAFFRKFEIIRAGGGLVLNESREVLMIHRRGFWDLPKGKLDEGETIEACALREVKEETGLSQVELGAPLLITYHTYEQGTHHILKESHWFIMKGTATEQLVPQTEEDITAISWVAPTQIAAYKEQAYPSIVDVLDTWEQTS